MDVFDLFAKISLDTSEYTNGLNEASQQGASFKSVLGNILGKGTAAVAATVTAVGAAAVATGKNIYDSITQIASLGDEIDKQSQKLGISTALYQSLGYAAELSGTSIDSLSLGVKNITNSLADMAAGVEDASKNYDAIGVSLTNTDGSLKSTETVLMESILALADMEDETKRNAAANDIFGRSYQDLIPLLNSGSDGIAAMMEEAEAYGMIMSNETVKASANFEDALTKLNGTVDGVKTKLFSDFMPSFTLMINGISDLLAENEGAEEHLVDGFLQGAIAFEGMSDKIISIIGSLIPAISTAAPTLIKTLLNGMMRTVSSSAPSIFSMVASIAKVFLEAIPQMLDVGIQTITLVINEAAAMAPELIPLVVQTIVDLITTLFSNSDELLVAAVALIDGLAQGVIAALPILISAMPSIISGIVGFIENSTTAVLKAATILLMALIDAIPLVITEINKEMPNIISEIIMVLQDAGPEMGVACLELLGAFLSAIPIIIADLWTAMPDVIQAIIDACKANWDKLVKNGTDSANEFLKGITASSVFTKIGEKVKNIIDKIKENFQKYFGNAVTWGKDLMDNFISGIKAKISELTSTISNVASTVKSYLGFSEPEKGPLSNFHTYAPDMMQLFTEGIYDNEDMLIDAIDDVFDIQDKIGEAEISVSGSSTGLMNMLAEYLPQIANMQIVMDTGATVGQLAPSMDVALGKRLIASGRSI